MNNPNKPRFNYIAFMTFTWFHNEKGAENSVGGKLLANERGHARKIIPSSVDRRLGCVTRVR
jgi:hypothetical protein